MRPLRSLTSVVVVVLALAACSSGDDEPLAEDTTTTTGATTSTTQATTTTTLATTTTSTVAPSEGATALVSAIQQQLQALGYFEGVTDGIYGPVTAAAITEFQQDVGITADGEYGPETYSALAVAMEKDPDYVSDVQEGLKEVGLYSGPVDGQYGSGSKRAVEALQEDCELPIEVDGRLTPQTHVCLEDAVRAA